MFYKGYINEEESYDMVKEQKVDFELDTINELFGLEANEVENVDVEDKDEKEEDDVPLKRKRKAKDQKEQSPLRPRTLRKPCSLRQRRVPQRRSPKPLISPHLVNPNSPKPLALKLSPSPKRLHHLPKNLNCQPQPKKFKGRNLHIVTRGKFSIPCRQANQPK
ncbi:hypothetical protein E5676_scaffold186G001070 [Cucumis melo var. makuwa]|uniref:Uncharacterized protein n=1 Tax=Cucumis melo var. makuwa TaxID=1194695 RepID=A0A5A7VEH4_CUCMM|nr:hypothetical protein E6C27_scaffold90G001650 [Cucumis melo var. makuwa]TYK14445.1 hypothetical protein E5676_scaffold186G001070 [Cucumis melo var. makuwa]